MKAKTWALLCALLALTAALLTGCGSSDDDTSSASKPAGNPTDRAFVADMIPHHQSAVEMAAVAKTEATSMFVKDLAADITRTQNAEISEMQRVDAQLPRPGSRRGTSASTATRWTWTRARRSCAAQSRSTRSSSR